MGRANGRRGERSVREPALARGMVMSIEALPDAVHQSRGRRTAVALVLTLAVFGDVIAPIWRFVYGSVYDDAAVYVVANAVAVVSLSLLAAMPRSTPYLGVILALVAIPGALALQVLGFYVLVIWTGGVHTLTSGWGSIGWAFALIAPIFTPLLSSGLAILLRDRSARNRYPVVVHVAAGAFFLSLSGLLRFYDPPCRRWDNCPMPIDDTIEESTPPAPSAFNTDSIPLGELAWKRILDHVVSVGDEAETSYLEVKSDIDLASKVGMAKVAKFLLGAANRRALDAVRHFRGYAVLVIGAKKGEAAGVPRGTEAHEVEDSLRPYLGPQFPAFEFGRVRVSDENEVLFVIAQPPEAGQSIFPCHKEFQGAKQHDNLADGAIYVRGKSNSRPARAGEVLGLVERARGGGKPPISLEVDLLGRVHRVARIDEVLRLLRDLEEEQFVKEPVLAEDAFARTSIMLASSAFGGTAHLTQDDRDNALMTWRNRTDEHLSTGRKHLLGAALEGAGISVLSHDRFISKPHLVVTFHGCELVDYVGLEGADHEEAVIPVLQNRDPLRTSLDLSSLRQTVRNYPVAWSNDGDDARVTLTPDSFRPNVSWTSDQDDYIVVARDKHAESIDVSWALTEDGSDVTTKGSFQVQTGSLADAADLYSEVFLSEP